MKVSARPVYDKGKVWTRKNAGRGSCVMRELLVGTHNKGKVAELSDLLAHLPITLRYLAEMPDITEIEETGETFAENARLKARAYAAASGLFTLADDSGLEVFALDGRPGVFSARYGGAGTGFDQKMAKLLGELEATGDQERLARFVCTVAIADETGGIVFEAMGTCPGRVAPVPRGAGGFGYDPLFVPDGYQDTFGELASAVKQKISHRVRAFGQIIPFLRDFMAI